MHIQNFNLLSPRFLAGLALLCSTAVYAQDGDKAAKPLMILADKVVTLEGPVVENGAVLVVDGKIKAVGPRSEVERVKGSQEVTTLEAAIATPGLVDIRSTLGFSGIYNVDADQDQLETSEPIQAALRASDAFNSKEELIEWVRGFGVTTIHAGHGPGELVSGQTAIFKLAGGTMEDSLVRDHVAVAATLAESAQKSDGKSPGTRGKMVAMLREKFIAASEYVNKMEAAKKSEDKDLPARDLNLEAFARVLSGEQSMLVTADAAQDIASALRLAKEFNFKLWIDSGSEVYTLLDEVKAAGVPVLLHPTMMRFSGTRKNASFTTAAKLQAAGIPFAIQSGYEPYVPKARVVLFEAAVAAANGLSFEEALSSVTIDAAKILGIDSRVGSLAVGKDADIALFDGDPFEYTTHCTSVVIDGKVFSGESH